MGLKTPEASTTKLIVGIDYGTTYSGLSFALSTAQDFRDIFPWTKYPGAASHHAEHCVKAPTLIAFASENRDLDADAWGYQIEPDMHTCAQTKLLLDRTALPTAFDDPDLYDAGSGETMRLPRGRTAVDVAAAYLRHVFAMFDRARHEYFGGVGLEGLATDFWLTVPASWSERAKLLTKKAAREAGFGVREMDRLLLISEPEAAAQYALKSGLGRLDSYVKRGTGVMVCDCGGGTVDVTSYEIKETRPTLKLRETAIGVAGKCGGSYVDRNLFKLMSFRFGDAFATLPAKEVGPGSNFMDQFELKKKDFGDKDQQQRVQRIPLLMPKLKHTQGMDRYYEKRSSSVLLTHDDFKILFDPVICKILALINEQVSQVLEKEEPAIETLVLVGGFASSPYLKKSVIEWCEARGIRMTTPYSGAWSAVVCGAVLRGLEGSIVEEKKCRRHYGHKISRPYDSFFHFDYDRNLRKTWEDPFENGATYLTGFIKWAAKKGQLLRKGSEMIINFVQHDPGEIPPSSSLTLLACSLDDAPETIENDRVEEVGEIKIDLSLVKRHHFQAKSHQGKMHYQLALKLIAKLDDELGHLVFRVMHEEQELGKAEIDLED